MVRFNDAADIVLTAGDCIQGQCGIIDVAFALLPVVNSGISKLGDDALGFIRAVPEDQLGTSQAFKIRKGEDGLSVFEDVSPEEVLAELPGKRVPNTTVNIPKNGLPPGTKIIPTKAEGLSQRLSDAHRILVPPDGMSNGRFADKIKVSVGWER